MNENFSQDKILKYLIAVLVIVGIFILVNFLFLKPSPPSFLSEKPLREVKIDFDTFEDSAFQKLLPFEKISFPEEVGRENPFESY